MACRIIAPASFESRIRSWNCCRSKRASGKALRAQRDQGLGAKQHRRFTEEIANLIFDIRTSLAGARERLSPSAAGPRRGRKTTAARLRESASRPRKAVRRQPSPRIDAFRLVETAEYLDPIELVASKHPTILPSPALVRMISSRRGRTWAPVRFLLGTARRISRTRAARLKAECQTGLTSNSGWR